MTQQIAANRAAAGFPAPAAAAPAHDPPGAARAPKARAGPDSREALPEANGSGARSTAELREELRRLEDHLRATDKNLQFTVAEDLGRVVVAVVDGETGEVLRQIPSDEALRIARGLREQGYGLVDDNT